MCKSVAVALSGGIDSLYSAHLLKDMGHSVQGVHFITGYSRFPMPSEADGQQTKGQVICHSPVDPGTLSAMAAISEKLGIPIHIIDLSEVFRKNVVDYFIGQYKTGRTPNPCIVCNPLIKFGVLLDFAGKIGADCLATGHYARIIRDSSGVPRLFKGKDPKKDQSYFLSFLKKEQLDRIVFPLGDLHKTEISLEAKNRGLTPVSDKESQDVCFIEGDYSVFLQMQPGFEPIPGSVVTTEGKTVGRHQGLHAFTIGQRRGINCPAPYPYYVVRLNTAEGKLIVGSKDELYSSSCRVKDVSWVNSPPEYPATIFVKIRYSHKGSLATVAPSPDGLTIDFHEPVMSVTPGQAAVFYTGDEVLGGGFIE